MRRPILAAFVLCAVLPFAPSAYAQSNFAALLPLTGSTADQGEWARRGFEIADAELKAAPGYSATLSFEDSKGDPATAVQAYKSLQARGRVDVVFSYGSGIGLALSPLTNGDHAIQMGIATATPKYRSEGDYTFRVFPSATLEADFLAHALIEKLKQTRIAIISIENDYGVGTAGALKSAYTALGGSVVFEQSFSPGENDFKPLLLKLKQSNVDLVYLPVYPAEGAVLLKQAKQLAMGQKFLGSIALVGGKEFFQIAGDAADGLMVVSSIPAAQSNFSKVYDKKYPGEAPAQLIYAARAYDALKIVAGTLPKCSGDTTCMRDELFKIKNYPGASGEITFDSCGDTSSSFALFQVRNRAFEAVK